MHHTHPHTHSKIHTCIHNLTFTHARIYTDSHSIGVCVCVCIRKRVRTCTYSEHVRIRRHVYKMLREFISCMQDLKINMYIIRLIYFNALRAYSLFSNAPNESFNTWAELILSGAYDWGSSYRCFLWITVYVGLRGFKSLVPLVCVRLRTFYYY